MGLVKARACADHLREIRIVNRSVLHTRLREPGSLEGPAGNFDFRKIGRVEPRSGAYRVIQDCGAQVGVQEIGAFEIGAFEPGPAQICAGQIRVE